MSNSAANVNELDCKQCQNRFYDPDCRPAVANSSLPHDVAAHLARCPACQQQWQTERLFDAELNLRLVLAPPPAVYRRALVAIVETAPGMSFWADYGRSLSQALVSGAIVSALLTATPWAEAYPWLLLPSFALAALLSYLPELMSNDDAAMG